MNPDGQQVQLEQCPVVLLAVADAALARRLGPSRAAAPPPPSASRTSRCRPWLATTVRTSFRGRRRERRFCFRRPAVFRDGSARPSRPSAGRPRLFTSAASRRRLRPDPGTSPAAPAVDRWLGACDTLGSGSTPPWSSRQPGSCTPRRPSSARVCTRPPSSITAATRGGSGVGRLSSSLPRHDPRRLIQAEADKQPDEVKHRRPHQDQAVEAIEQSAMSRNQHAEVLQAQIALHR